CARDHSSFDSW
nr:immunoglobulin heavy chain junction region [Macaca mulatta]MOV39785.1 immunoglobulin heavy chain junction region [Macaca mulatta]MOV40111.1 immunoglobulin heavy chain junction region [Macaca mulatta]MOV41340.1 immunoglobulin heavy chain junction region [Macaca mulatta]MOV46342.1 immunoglobulin heavy chain junction region [Macaca mulatta]